MLFCSWNYLVFFVLVMSVYWAIPWHRPRVYLLLAASYFFYASWSSWLALVIFCSATLDYFNFRFKDEIEFTAFDDKFHKDRKIAAIYALLDDIVEAEKSDFKIFERRL